MNPSAARKGVLAAGLIAALTAGLTACSQGGASRRASDSSRASSARTSSQPPLGYRSLPSFLPSSTSPVDGVVTASAKHPQLAVQGVGVRVELPTGQALATVSGPHVPPFVTPPPPAVTATFDVSLVEVSGHVPVRPADFTITDQLGRTFHPTLVGPGGAPPASISAGHTARFRLTAVMPTGEGRIFWAPTRSSALVGWDFIVEND